MDPHNGITTQEINDAISKITSSDEYCDSLFIIWNKGKEISNPHLFVEAMNTFFKRRTNDNIKVSSNTGSLDFIFDHYFPLIEATNTNDQKLITARIILIQFLCNLLIDYPQQFNPYLKYLRMMWGKLLKIMRSVTNPTIMIESFRCAISLFSKTVQYLEPKMQAKRLLELVINNNSNAMLHIMSVRFAISIKPAEFGFVTLCKTMFSKGISDPRDLGLISEILSYPCVKNPTDVYKFLFVSAVTHKTMSNACIKVIKDTLGYFEFKNDVKTWIQLFTKRCFQFLAFCEAKSSTNIKMNENSNNQYKEIGMKKYLRRSFLIRRLYEKMINLNIDWLDDVIYSSVFTLIYMGRCLAFLRGRFGNENKNPLSLIDGKFKEEIEATSIDSLDLKNMLFDVKITLPINTIEVEKRPTREYKPTISEIKSSFRTRRIRKVIHPTNNSAITDLEMLMKMQGPINKESNIIIDNTVTEIC